MTKKMYHGMHWLRDGNYGSVSCWIDSDGEKTITYNLSDHTGDHEFPKRKTKKLAHIWDKLIDAREHAIADAIANKEYTEARRRPGASERFAFVFAVTIGRGGFTFYCDESRDSTSTVQGYHLTDDEIAEIDRLGIPFIDSRTISDDNIGMTISFPMIGRRAGESDPAPWGSLSHAPLDVIAGLYHSIGATVRNIAPRMPEPHELRSDTLKEKMAIAGYFGHNPELLGAAIMMD